jgi:hypothetical protein
MSIRRGLCGPVFVLCLSSWVEWAFAVPIGSPVFINEFHYDNAGADTGEFIELAGAAGTDLNGWSLHLYNGAGGKVYKQWSLSSVLADDTATGFGFLLLDLPAGGLQNGSPDGIALVDALGLVQEFLSYEGMLTAVDGPAAGMTSADVMVSESGSTPVGASLQRGGNGMVGADFVWQALDVATPGQLNAGQHLAGQQAEPLSVSVWPLWLLGLWGTLRRAGVGSVV